MLKQGLTVVGLVFVGIVVLHSARIGVNLRFIDALERNAYDLRVRLSARTELDNRVVIIDLDDRSLQEQSQWPWPRELFAQLNDKLYDQYQVDTIGYDITFPEPEARYTDSRVAEFAKSAKDQNELLARLRAESGDQLLARSMQDRSIVLGYVFEDNSQSTGDDINAGVLPAPLFALSSIPIEEIISQSDAPAMTHYISNVPILAENAMTLGFFSIAQRMKDADGIIRRIELLNKYRGQLYGSLTLQVFQSYTTAMFEGAEPIIVDGANDYKGLEGLRLIYGDIPLDEQAAVYVPYASPRGVYEYISATDILNGTYDQDISGAIALIGTSAQGLVDLRNTPVAADLPGVEVHANVLSAMLDGNFRVKPSWVTALDVLLVSLVGLLFCFLLPRVSALMGLLVFVGASGLILGVNWYFWQQQSLILSVAPVLFVLSSLYIVNTVAGFFSETHARRSTQKMFGLYVPPEVVDEISDTKDIFSMKPEKKDLTVLFTDIRGFTTISEGMPPDELSEWMNDFLTPMTRIIHKSGGAIDKYMGDCIMAFWGAPIADDDHAAHGIQAAIDIIKYLDVLNAEFRAKKWPEIQVGVGLNSGPMSVGNMGSEFRMAYTVLGDAVNLGARLESITKEYGVDICVSEFTKAKAPEFNYTELDTVKVKGKNEAVTIFSVNP